MTILRIILNVTANYFPLIRRIPVGPNQRFNRVVEVVNRVSKELVEERYHEAQNNKLNKKDLLSLIVNINRSLPIEEKLEFNEIVLYMEILKYKRYFDSDESFVR